jgi:hypothetical protein
MGNVSQTREMRNAYKILIRSMKGRDYLGDLTVDGWTILR